MDMTLLTSAIVPALISAVVSWCVAKRDNSESIRRDLDAELSEILKIGIAYPYFEQESFTNTWIPSLARTEEKYAAYEIYATLVFNHLEKRCRFRKFKLAVVQNDVDIRSWVILHKNYWKNPVDRYENITGYDKKFFELVEFIIQREERTK